MNQESIKIKIQDEAEANGAGLRVPEALLRDADHREPETAKGAAGAEGPQVLAAAAVLHAIPGRHPLHVPLLREDRQNHIHRHRRPQDRRRCRFGSSSGAAQVRPPLLQPLRQIRSMLINSIRTANTDS